MSPRPGSPWWGGLLLFTYGVGLGLPILLLGTVAGTFLQRLQSPVARRVVNATLGGTLVAVGLYMVWLA